MIRLTTETKTIKVNTKNHTKGDEVDNSLYLVRVDENNLALKRGDRIENYFGDVKTALKRSVNYAVKGSSLALSLESMDKTIQSIYDAIERLEKDAV